MVETSHYAVLRVPVNATPDQIRAAYKRRAIGTHPDKTNDDGEAFKAVQAAYTILQDALAPLHGTTASEVDAAAAAVRRDARRIRRPSRTTTR